MIPVVKAKLLEGKKGLIVGIANENPIAWGCAKAFRALGSDLAVTYLNEKAKKYVEPLARELEAPILMPLDVNGSGLLVFAAVRYLKSPITRCTAASAVSAVALLKDVPDRAALPG